MRKGRICTGCLPVNFLPGEGPARLVGMDAGDLLDLSLYSSPGRRMFNGLLLAAVMVEGKGEVRVTFASEDGAAETVTFRAE